MMLNSRREAAKSPSHLPQTNLSSASSGLASRSARQDSSSWEDANSLKHELNAGTEQCDMVQLLP